MNYIKLSSILIFLFSIQIGFSQNYLNETSKWYNIYGDSFDKWYHLERSQVIGDTIINDTSYFKIHTSRDLLSLSILTGDTSSYYPNIESIRLLREENKSFFYRSNNIDYILLNFNLNLGDTIIASNGFPTEVIQVDTLIVGNEIRKVFQLDMGEKIYEGIGTSQGLFTPISFPIGEYFSQLKCYFHDDVQYNINDQFIFWQFEIPTCDSLFFEEIITSTEQSYSENLINIYPNPFSNEVNIKFSNKYNSAYFIAVTNLNGENIIIKKIKSDTGKFTLDLSFLKKGIYFINVKSNNKMLIRKIVKI